MEATALVSGVPSCGAPIPSLPHRLGAHPHRRLTVPLSAPSSMNRKSEIRKACNVPLFKLSVTAECSGFLFS
jgi:hypothetical protein